MKHRYTTCLLAFCLLFFSCSKNGDNPSNALEGTWIFTNNTTAIHPYLNGPNSNPSILYSAYTTSKDSTRITFSNGKFTFLNYSQPVDEGTYEVVDDSLLVIKPDTAAFVKFNYNVPVLFYGTTDTNTTVPKLYGNFRFTSDTLVFKQEGETLAFSATWISRADNPVNPGADTLRLNKTMNYFKKK